MAKAKALELLALSGFGLTAKLSPAGTIQTGGVLHQLLLSGRILLPPVVIRHAAPIAQQIVIPVLAATDASIARLEAANAAFHLVVGARERFPIVALDEMRSQVGEHLQELPQTLLLEWTERPVCQVPSQALTPVIETTPDLGIAQAFSWLGPAAVEDVLDIQHPLVHVLDLRQGLLPGNPLRDNRLEACHLLSHQGAHGRPLFSNCSRLASTSSNAWAAATAGYLNGKVPSKFSAVSTPNA